MMSVTVFAADSGVLDVMGQSGMTIINRMMIILRKRWNI